MGIRVQAFKRLVEDVVKIPADDMRLSHKGNVLHNRRTLLESGVEARQCLIATSSGGRGSVLELRVYPFDPSAGLLTEPFLIRVRLCDTIIQLKQQLAKLTGIAISEQRISHSGRSLANESRLCDCGIRDERATLQLSCALRSSQARSEAPLLEDIHQDWSSVQRVAGGKMRCQKGTALVLAIHKSWPPRGTRRFSMHRGHTIARLKEMLHEWVHISQEHLQLYYRGTKLQDQLTFEFYNLQGGECLHLLMHPRPHSGSVPLTGAPSQIRGVTAPAELHLRTSVNVREELADALVKDTGEAQGTVDDPSIVVHETDARASIEGRAQPGCVRQEVHHVVEDAGDPEGSVDDQGIIVHETEALTAGHAELGSVSQREKNLERTEGQKHETPTAGIPTGAHASETCSQEVDVVVKDIGKPEGTVDDPSVIIHNIATRASAEGRTELGSVRQVADDDVAKDAGESKGTVDDPGIIIHETQACASIEKRAEIGSVRQEVGNVVNNAVGTDGTVDDPRASIHETDVHASVEGHAEHGSVRQMVDDVAKDAGEPEGAADDPSTIIHETEAPASIEGHAELASVRQEVDDVVKDTGEPEGSVDDSCTTIHGTEAHAGIEGHAELGSVRQEADDVVKDIGDPQ
eukprot:TRINITY_DN11616_c0_g1_i1.p1 TRINITY_DN11616_c0_g1~~TRINITY_DN11616_c0_g1_i1.p1  ORF type:complete len:742 (-),score=107.75 TRINITY_DN11616_c0_g1_i1:511-2412(-)